MSAYDELIAFLEEGETVDAVVFGPWGWGSAPASGGEWEADYGEPDPPPVPFERRGQPMTLEEAAPMMESWRFYGGFGAPECYAVYVWTNRRVIWVTQYDGATSLNAAPRHPTPVMPDMPGG